MIHGFDIYCSSHLECWWDIYKDRFVYTWPSPSDSLMAILTKTPIKTKILTFSRCGTDPQNEVLYKLSDPFALPHSPPIMSTFDGSKFQALKDAIGTPSVYCAGTMAVSINDLTLFYGKDARSLGYDPWTPALESVANFYPTFYSYLQSCQFFQCL